MMPFDPRSPVEFNHLPRDIPYITLYYMAKVFVVIWSNSCYSTILCNEKWC